MEGMRQEETAALAALALFWPQVGAWQALAPQEGGTNHRAWRVETSTGLYILLLTENHADPRRLRFEHGVMERLAARGLPFALPLPLPTARGERFALVPPSDAAPDGAPATLAALATLAPLIPGAHPLRGDLPQAEAAGEALGLLDGALAGAAPPDPAEALSWRSAGDLTRCHPLVPDPRAALGELPIPEQARARLIERYDWLVAHIPAHYARLPQQLCHEDYDPSNVLMAGRRVTGVLDFELCARDARVMDLTVALSWWPVERFGSGDEWPIIAAFTRGYARHVALTAGEAEALPTLMLLRGYTSLIHRLGRHRQGLDSRAAVVARAEAALARDEWLRANSARLSAAVGDGAP